MRKMSNPERAKFILVNGMTPEDYQEKAVDEFIRLNSLLSTQKNEKMRKYLYDRITEALKKVE